MPKALPLRAISTTTTSTITMTSNNKVLEIILSLQLTHRSLMFNARVIVVAVDGHIVPLMSLL